MSLRSCCFRSFLSNWKDVRKCVWLRVRPLFRGSSNTPSCRCAATPVLRQTAAFAMKGDIRLLQKHLQTGTWYVASFTYGRLFFPSRTIVVVSCLCWHSCLVDQPVNVVLRRICCIKTLQLGYGRHISMMLLKRTIIAPGVV